MIEAGRDENTLKDHYPMRRALTALLATFAFAMLALAACSEDDASPTAAGTPSRTSQTAVAAATATGTAVVDLKRLPIGDGKYGASPQRGSIVTCQRTLNGGGAFATGAWVHGDGTFDATAKPVVSGSVNWPHSFTMSRAGTDRVFTGNDLPEHSTGTFPIPSADAAYQYDRNPNAIKAQSVILTVPGSPVLAPSPSCVRGEAGIMLSGVLIFDGLDAGGRDAVAHEIQDSCGGHPQMQGVYHYHNLPSCVADKPSGSHSELLGYALDGFGIYGRYGEDGRELTNADLDECHGHSHQITWDGQGVTMYHYHMTAEYPYTVGCFRGSTVVTVNLVR